MRLRRTPLGDAERRERRPGLEVLRPGARLLPVLRLGLDEASLPAEDLSAKEVQVPERRGIPPVARSTDLVDESERSGKIVLLESDTGEDQPELAVVPSAR
jgi:hypothetical protein